MADQPVFTRRRLLTGAAALGLGAAGVIATTGPPFGRGARTISFWHLFSGGDGERMNQMLDAFAQSGSEVKVEPVTLTWGPPYYTKLQLAAVGGRPPAVAVAHATRLASPAAAPPPPPPPPPPPWPRPGPPASWRSSPPSCSRRTASHRTSSSRRCGSA